MRKHILEDMERLDQRTVDESNRFHGLCLYEEDLANMRRWRATQCAQMISTISDMMQSELHRIKSQ